MLSGKMNVIQYQMFEFRMLGVHSNSVEPNVQHVLCHCYAAINIFIKISNILIIFSYTNEKIAPWLLLYSSGSCMFHLRINFVTLWKINK